MFPKLLVQGTHRRISNVDRHIGMVVNGKIPDGRHIMNYGRNEAQKFFKDFDVVISGRTLANRLALYLNAYTLYNSVRPFGSSEIIASWNEDEGYHLYMLEPSGAYYGYTCCTSGKGRQTAKAEFEKTDFSKLACREALYSVAKMYSLINPAFCRLTRSPATRSTSSRSAGSARRATTCTSWSAPTSSTRRWPRLRLPSRRKRWVDDIYPHYCSHIHLYLYPIAAIFLPMSHPNVILFPLFPIMIKDP